MRILLTTVSLDAERGGGTAERTRRLASRLRRAGQDCEVATIEGGALGDVLRHEGVPVHVTGSVRLRFVVPFLRPVTLWSMVRRADVVHVLGYWNLLSVATALCAHLAGKPYLLSAAGEFAGLARRRPVARLFHRLFGLRMIRQATGLVAVTEQERQQIAAWFGYDRKRILVVPNGVEEDQETAANAADFLPGEPFVLFVGRLALIKGPDLLLEAFARIGERHPGVRLVVAGPDFGLGPALHARASIPPLAGRVVFPGFLGEGERTAAYERALLLVVPSRAEAMSLVAVEAGLCGTPVLVTDQCGLDEVAEVGGGGVCAADPDAVAAALDAMLSAGDLAEKGRRWRRHVLANYTWTSITARFVDQLEGLR